MTPNIPSCAWQRSLFQGWEQPYTVRYPSNLDDGPWHGMPLGGFGAGCLGRSPAGDFNLWHLDGGEHEFRSLPACQCSVFEQVGDATPQAYAMGPKPPAGVLAAWDWYPPEVAESSSQSATGYYAALYPRSWFVYEQVWRSSLTCEQFSPILAGNYQETSYPIAVFEWTAQNPTDQPVTLSILLTWQNSVGWFKNTRASSEIVIRDDGSPVYEYASAWGQSQGNWNQVVKTEQMVAIVLGQGDPGAQTTPAQEGDGQWCMAVQPPAGATVFAHSRWHPEGDGAELWSQFAQDGSIPNCDDETPAAAGEQIAAALAIRLTLQPGETVKIPLVLSWDFPLTEFAKGIAYHRRYTDFFGRSGHNAAAIALTGLQQYPIWQQQIRQWQQPVLDRSDLPDWLKMALFNELYYLTDGGTLWTAASEADPIGQFGVLECLDYRWYESLDVRLYGSFGLLELWPDLDKAVLRAFARAVPAADLKERIIGYYLTLGQGQYLAPRKCAGATPHDLGAPNEHPWEKTNYTAYQDCNLWKDLASDFVLQVYRAYVFTGQTDTQFLQDCWSAIVTALNYLKQFDLDQDNLPENSGAPDQTFDDWRLQGISAYCGGLWLAALEAAIAIGTVLQATDADPDAAAAIASFQTWLSSAKPLYHQTLWNGQYYQIDSQSGSDVVMTDQLCGQFYARLLGLPDIVPAEAAQTALKTVYEVCYKKFNHYLAEGGISGSDGRIAQAVGVEQRRSRLPLGAANGVRPDGSPENPNATHPLEVWTGINFGLAALLVQSGLKTEGFELAEAIVRQVYDNGLQFRTPEAITANATFRACHYLRAMAIWAIYRVME